MATAPVYYPAVAPSITERAGTRGGTHTGIDLAANLNDPVLAPFDGQVVFVGGDGARAPIWLGTRWLSPNGEGLTVDIRRADGLIARLGHLNGFAVRQGDWVTAGQTIGYAGTTGYSTGVHIHWELRWDRAWVGGNWIDPLTLNPQTFQEDDMYTDADRKRDDTVRAEMKITMQAVGRIEQKLWTLAQEVNQIHATVDVNKWALTNSTAGVRTGIAEVAKLVAKLPGSKLDASKIEAALSADDVAKIAKAVTDEHAKRLKA